MTLQAAPVDRPLGSVKRMCQAGHRVVFDSDGSYVLNKATKEVNWLREENGNYMLDMWVAPASWLQQGTSDMTKGFTRLRLRTGTRVKVPSTPMAWTPKGEEKLAKLKMKISVGLYTFQRPRCAWIHEQLM